MKKKIILFWIVISFVFSLILIMEGKPKISCTNENNLVDLINEKLPYQNLELVSSAKKDDVRIDVFYDENDTIYIVEITKNTFFDLFSISEINEFALNGETYNSVISSATKDYSFSIDLNNFNIEIFEPNISSNVYYAIFNFIVIIVVFIRLISVSEVSNEKNG